MNESKEVICEACGTAVKARGIKPHRRGCRQYQDLIAATGVTPIIDARPPSREPAAVATSSAAVAAAIANANGGAAADPIAEAVAGEKPAGKHVEPKVVKGRNDDGPPLQPAQKLDELSERMGADTFRAGTENRFNWCREYEGGPRHTFSRMYFVERVLVDVYQTRAKGVEAEVKFKAGVIAARNATVSHEERWGYFAVIRDENKATDDTILRALAGECVVLENKVSMATRRQVSAPRVANGLEPEAVAV